jgi:hypothetical protein
VNYRFLTPAREELIEALTYYQEAIPGHDLVFLEEVERAVTRIILQPEAWCRISDRHRRCLLRRFPFGLIYSIEHDEIIIAAVMNCRRHPDSWKRRRGAA